MEQKPDAFKILNDEQGVPLSVFINGRNCLVDQKNFTFVYDNDTYVIFNNALPLRTHESVCRYRDKLYTFYCAIKLDDMRAFLSWFSSLGRHFVRVCGYESCAEKPFSETLQEIEEYMTTTIKTHIEDNLFADNVEMIKLVYNNMSSMFQLLKEETLIKTLYTTDAVCVRLGDERCKRGDISSERIGMNDSVGYISSYVTFADCLIDNMSNNYTPLIIFHMLYMILIDKSIFEDQELLCGKSNTFINAIISMFVDVITDRITTEMFVCEKNSTAKRIKQHYYVTFPFLRRYNSPADMTNVHKEIFKKGMQTINETAMFPYVMLWNFSDKLRVQTMYEHYRNVLFSSYKNATHLDENQKRTLENLPDKDTMWNALCEVTGGVENGMYNIVKFSELIISIFKLTPIVDYNNNYNTTT